MVLYFQVLVAPPLFRHQPTWYSKGLTQVASRFSAVFSTNAPPNLHLLPSFSCQDLEADGKHLTPVSGLHYILHLCDQTEAVLTRATLTTDSQLSQVQEQVRHHEDRMSYLENHHVGLQKQVSTKVAVDAEFSDWIQNRNDEDWLVIKGLPRLNVVSDKEWPAAVKKQVSDCISLVLRTNRTRLDFEVLHVANPFKLRNTGPTLYNVRMDSFYSSKTIRDTFSGFFRHVRPVALPPALKGLSFRNKVTLETKVRIAILHQLGTRYKESNAGGMYKVHGYDPRPVLVTFPPRSGNARPRTFNFIQAVTTLPANFSDESLVRIFQVVGDRFRGRLQALFVVLNDDDHDRCLELVKASYDQRSGARGDFHFGASGSRASAATLNVGQVQGFGSGMDLEAATVVVSPTPEEVSVFPTETSNSRAHDERVRLRRREDVRLPSPELDRPVTDKRRHQSSESESSQHSETRRKSKKSKKKSKKRSRRSSSSGSDSEVSGSGSGHTKSKSKSTKSRK